ncbi:MAG: vitamin B12 dependent-methionine synthase activation domain-containing protein [bacterium]
MISVPIAKIKPDIDKLKRKLHIKSGIEEDLLAKVFERLVQDLDPKYSYKKVRFDENPLAPLVLSSKELASFLKGAEEGFVVVCTIGKGTVKLIEEYQENSDMACALYADRIASDMVEELAEHTAKELLNKFFDPRDYELSKRYSPGYGDLDLDRQRDLFDLFKPEELDIALTPQNYMSPEKSISYIVGILPRR